MRNEAIKNALITLWEAHHIAELISKIDGESEKIEVYKYETACRGIARLTLEALMTLEEEL
ncbi:hypothetical protein BKG94_07280 [Rodentibacter ratti]|uniref:hypothetical protein n=1 Tax=Rodentibacter ratti TaxID=1906745 RepID=UPI0009845606|nr:hypothetical protein [Rodentibacter ratti]OOF88326.1 hypothetical protein BKG94_07280 [Rodentibacter ratti]